MLIKKSISNRHWGFIFKFVWDQNSRTQGNKYYEKRKMPALDPDHKGRQRLPCTYSIAEDTSQWVLKLLQKLQRQFAIHLYHFRSLTLYAHEHHQTPILDVIDVERRNIKVDVKKGFIYTCDLELETVANLDSPSAPCFQNSNYSYTVESIGNKL